MFANTTRAKVPVGSLSLKYFHPLYIWLGCIQSILYLTVGSVGNIMVITVVSRSSNMVTPTNCYLVSLAISDIFLLFVTTVPNLTEFMYPIDHWKLGGFLCSILVFLQYYCCSTSSLSITFFSIERWVAICFPLKAKTLCTIKRARIIIICIWTCCFLYNSMWLYLVRTVMKFDRNKTNGHEICTFRLERKYYTSIYMSDIILFYFLPLIIIFILYINIVMVLVRGNLHRSIGPSDRNRKSRVQVIKMLIVVVILFIVLWLPYRSFVVYNSFSSKKYEDYWFLMFARNMVQMNSAINPILYNAMSEKFRRAFKKVFKKGVDTIRINARYNNIPSE